MAKKTLPSSEKAKIVMETVEERLALDPVLLDLTDKVLLFDYVLVCAGNSDTHVRAITNAVLERIDDENIAPPRVAGQGIGEWVLMDFGDVIVHVLSEEARERYKLETFWSTAQPKGALPPMPTDDGVYAGATITDAGFDDSDEDLDEDDDEGDELTDEELDALDIDDEDPDDVSFFNTADKEVEPIDEPDDLPSETEEDETKTDAKGDN